MEKVRKFAKNYDGINWKGWNHPATAPLAAIIVLSILLVVTYIAMNDSDASAPKQQFPSNTTTTVHMRDN